MSDRASPPAEQTVERLLALADACVLCGLCLPHCPTYALDATEAESPRGRIVLVQALARNSTGVDASSAAALDHCLGCGRCEQVCPAKVRFGELMRLSRRLLPSPRRGLRVHALLWASRHPQRIADLLPALRAVRMLLPRQTRRVLADAGTAVTAARLYACDRTSPPSLDSPLQSEHVPALNTPAHSTPRRIGLLTGCVARSLESRAQHAAACVLRACGHTVLLTQAQVCCGALDQHANRSAFAEDMAAINRRVWSTQSPDVMVTTASGCQGAYANALSSIAPVQDALSLLADDTGFAALSLRPINRRVALHLPCTQRGFDGAVVATRRVLARIPGLTVVELADTGCCGAAGTHMLQFPERANALRQPLVAAVKAASATTLVSANIGCRLHLAGAAELAGIMIRHPLELLAEALP